MQINEKINITDDLEIEFRKMYNECKKKYSTTREGIEVALKLLGNIKSTNPTNPENEIKNSIDILLKPIMHTMETKHSKLFSSSLLIVKKIVVYNLIKQSYLANVIQILRDILDNSYEEFIQIKVLETLLLMLNPQTIYLSENLVNNVLIICFKMFGNKSFNIKNTVSALLKQLVSISFDFLDKLLKPIIDKKNRQIQENMSKRELIKSTEAITDNIVIHQEKNEENGIIEKLEFTEPGNADVFKESDKKEIDINVKNDIDLEEFTSVEIYQISLKIFKDLILIAEGKKKEWIAPTIYSKCLGLELLSGIISSTREIMKYLPEFYELIKQDLYKIIKKNLESTNDYIMGLKLCRISIQITENLNICLDLIQHMLKYAEIQSFSWQKLLGLECISSLCGDNFLIKELFNKSISQNENEKCLIYQDIINTLTKISYSIINIKNNDLNKKQDPKKNDKIKNMKLIEVSSILTENDAVNIPTFSLDKAFKLLTECYSNLLDSFTIILDTNNIKLSIINLEFTHEQSLCKQLVNSSYENIKNAMTVLLLNSSDDSLTQTYLNLYQSFINICGSLNLPTARDCFLGDICKLAIPNNLENSYEMKEKNLLIAKSIFNISHCLVQILDYNSWMLLIETMQKIYLMLVNTNNYSIKQSEEFEIDLVLHNLESNIRRYNPNFELSDSHNEIQKKANLENEKIEENIILEENKEVIPDKESNTNHQTNSPSISSSQKKKGILSSIKSVFNFSAKQDTNKGLSKKSPEESQMDFQIISAAIDSLYINSTSYDEAIINEICKALFENSKKIIENNSNMNDNLNIYLHFNLTKLLEISVINIKRIHICWQNLIDLIIYVCGKNLSFISKFSLETLTVTNIFALKQYKSENKSNLLEWSSQNWQKTIFSTYKAIASTNLSPEISMIIISSLQKILQNCGHYFDSSGWTNFIEICQILMLKSEEILITQTFELINNIIHEYVDNLSVYNINAFVDILESFSLHKGDINTSFIALTMFWNIANLIEKYEKLNKLSLEEINTNEFFSFFQKEFFYIEKNREEFFKSLWIYFFNKIMNISCDQRFEVRKSVILTFGDIFVAKISYIPNDISIKILNEYFLEILDKSYQNFEEKIKVNRSRKTTNNSDLKLSKSPNFNDNISDIKIGDFKIDQLKLPEKKSKFDEDNSGKYAIPSSQEKEWEDTSILLIQALGKMIKSFLSININKIKENSFYKEKLLDNLINKFCKIMRLSTPELACITLKCTQEIYFTRPDLYLENFIMIWSIFEELGRYITTDFFAANFCSLSTGSKLTMNIIEILKDLFTKESNMSFKNDLLKPKIISNLFNFTKLLLKSALNSEGPQSINNPQKLLTDEKLIFEFIESISKFLKTEDSLKIYCNYLSSFITYDLNDPHSEAHCRKSLELIEIFFTNNLNDTKLIKNFLIKFINEIKDLGCLRNKNEYVHAIIKNNKSPMQLWHMATFQLIKILSVVLCSSKKEGENIIVNEDNLLDKNDSNINEIWETSISYFETIFKQSEGGYKNISRNILEELIRSCQEMEIQIINFIVNGLLPNSLKIPREMQIKLLNLLDLGCNFDYMSFNQNSQISANNSSISKVCITNLFELCKYRSEESLKKDVINNVEDYVKIKIKIAKMSTPILIKRCRDTLKKFLDDEVKSGTMPLPRTRLEEMKFVLEKMKNLEIYPNYLNLDEGENYQILNNVMEIVMKNKKSHLFSLLPFLSEFITTREHDIKIIIKDIFKIITQEIGIK